MNDRNPSPHLLDIFEKVDKYAAIVAALVSAATFAGGNRIVSFAFILVACALVDAWLWRIANTRTTSGLLVGGKPVTRYTYPPYQRALLLCAAGLVTAAGLSWTIYHLVVDPPAFEKAVTEGVQMNLVERIQETAATATLNPMDGMAKIPAGKFRMGSDSDLDPPDPQRARPEHSVYLDDYWIDLYEVTNALYLEFVQATKHAPPANWENGDYPAQRANQPVTTVNWYDARDYCRYKEKRLPSEAEWEKAARGKNGMLYPWGNTFEDGKAHIGSDDIYDTKPVGSYPDGASPYGVFDMAGNVWEWVNDWYQADYYTLKILDNPAGPPQLQFKVMRGGAYPDAINLALTYNRLGTFEPGYSSPQVGFRCAK